MLTIRLSKADRAKAWRAMIEVAPVRLITTDPIYEVMPVHLELLAARGVQLRGCSAEVSPRGEAPPWHGRLEASRSIFRWTITTGIPSPNQNTWLSKMSYCFASAASPLSNDMDFREETELEYLRYLVRLKSRLKKKFDQLEILITVADLLAI